MKPRDYCCCAIPVMNAGIYATLAEQFTLGLLVGILALATPAIVGASVPSFAKWILAIIAFVAAGVQVLGFLGVFKEKAIMFRRYTTLHIMLTLAGFAVAAAWIIMSAAKHSTAVTDCEKDFFAANSTNSSNSDLDEGETLCNIFTWVDVGLMGGLWVLLAIMQFYLYTIISSYGTGQREDHDQYKSLYSVTGVGLDESGAIPLTNRAGADPWDARPSYDDDRIGARTPLARDIGRHERNESAASVSTIMGEKPQQEAPSVYSGSTGAGGGGGGYPPQRKGTYASTKSAYSVPPYAGPGASGGGFSYPSNAYTHDPQPTPQAFGPSSSNAAAYYGGSGYGNDNNNFERPGRTQAHPGTSD